MNYLDTIFRVYSENPEAFNILFGVIYFVGWLFHANNGRAYNFQIRWKYPNDHSKGIYTTRDTRQLSPKDVWRGLLWPVDVLIIFLKSILKLMIELINESLRVGLLFIGFCYEDTRLYDLINRWVK